MNLEALPVTEVLERAITHNTAALKANPPAALVKARISLSHSSIVGHPLQIDAKQNVVLATDSGLGYLNMKEATSIEILDPDSMLDTLTHSIAPSRKVVPPASPPRAKLRDQLGELNSKLERRYRLTLEADVLDDAALTDTGKNQFATFLNILDEALDAIASEDIGEITISSLGRAAIVLGEQLGVERSGSVMVIAVPFNEKFGSNFRAKLDTMLEASL